MRYSIILVFVMVIFTAGSMLWCEMSDELGLNYCPMYYEPLPDIQPQTESSSGIINYQNLENTDGQGAYLTSAFGLGTLYTLISGTWSFGNVLSSYFQMLFNGSAVLPDGFRVLINYIGRINYFVMLYQVFSRSSGGGQI